MANGTSIVMISSTAIDIPDYRDEAMNACLEGDMFPKMMEHLPALDADAIKASLDLVNEADVYLGIFAHRYGYIPKESNPLKISITEMEYNRAIERDIPRLIFIINKEYPVKPSNIDTGTKAGKLDRLKKRITTENVVKFFTSPENLHTHIVNSLAKLPKKPAADIPPKQAGKAGIRDVPPPPEKYIAHPYTLLQTHHLVGRKEELDLLTDWVSDPDSNVYREHILSVAAIGGLGKSALTWKWFDEIAPEVMKPLAGRMWWSFYDRDAYFENFILHALAYVSDSAVEDIRRIPTPERERKLLAALNREPFILVLDGFERELDAYSRRDGAGLGDSEVEIHRNARKTADPRVGQFLKKLAQAEKSRILISTRLQPAELENEVDSPLPGVFQFDLESLPDNDAMELWKTLGVQGSSGVLLPLFRQFDKHTLLIQALAGEVMRFRRAPGDLEKWLAANPTFDPAKYPKIKERTAHVLEFALRELGDKSLYVLGAIIAVRFPPSYETLAAICAGEGKPCAAEDEVDEILSDLENRGLIGWDKRTNRYDLHPIVRRVVWNGLGNDTRQNVLTSLQAHFETVPMIRNYLEVGSLEDLIPAIEIYNALIGKERYDDASYLFYERLDDATMHRLSASRQRVELLEMLFPDGLNQSPRLKDKAQEAYVLNALAGGYKYSGQPGRAVFLLSRANIIYSDMDLVVSLGVMFENQSNTLRMLGNLRDSGLAAGRALLNARLLNDIPGEGVRLQWLGLTLATQGNTAASESALRRSLRIDIAQFNEHGMVFSSASLAQRAIWLGAYADALKFANRAWEVAQIRKEEGDFIEAARRQGESALGLGDFNTTDERLHHALIRARAVNLVEEELPALIAIAELHRRQGDEKAAREFLDDVWEFAERGPYPLYHADALNVLAQIERDARNTDKAVEAATKAYELSWCDGPPYAYHWGLVKAQKHLEELGAALPEMKPFNEADYEPMPEFEIDPDDEFGESS